MTEIEEGEPVLEVVLPETDVDGVAVVIETEMLVEMAEVNQEPI